MKLLSHSLVGLSTLALALMGQSSIVQALPEVELKQTHLFSQQEQNHPRITPENLREGERMMIT